MLGSFAYFDRASSERTIPPLRQPILRLRIGIQVGALGDSFCKLGPNSALGGLGKLWECVGKLWEALGVFGMALGGLEKALGDLGWLWEARRPPARHPPAHPPPARPTI